MSTQYGWRPRYIDYEKLDLPWCSIIEIDEAKRINDRHIIATICKRYPIKPTTLRTRYNQWIAAGMPDAQEGDTGSGCSSQRGGQNRAFSHEEAYELAQYIINVYCNQHIQITLSDISLLAMEKYQKLHPHHTRNTPHSFHASPPWCYDFVKQYRVVRRRCGTHRVPTTPASPAVEAKYIADCKAALTKYGAQHVINLDETFWRIVNMIFYCYTKRGDPSPYINYHGDEKDGCTAALIVSADGDILSTVVVVEGKTKRSLTKLQLERFGGAIIGKFAPTSWMTSSIMVEIINDIIKPYLLRGVVQHPGARALILDNVGVHTTDEVAKAAAKINLELIWVPEGLTGTRQPIDVGMFGPMKAFIRADWRKKRLENLSYKPTYADAMQSLSTAINKITPHCIRSSFQQSIDHHTIIDHRKYPIPPPPKPTGPLPPIVSLPNIYERPGTDSKHDPWHQQSSNQQESSSESKTPLNEIEKEKEDAANALRQLAASIPPIPSLSSNPAMHNLPPPRKYGKQK